MDLHTPVMDGSNATKIIKSEKDVDMVQLMKAHFSTQMKLVFYP